MRTGTSSDARPQTPCEASRREAASRRTQPASACNRRSRSATDRRSETGRSRALRGQGSGVVWVPMGFPTSLHAWNRPAHQPAQPSRIPYRPGAALLCGLVERALTIRAWLEYLHLVVVEELSGAEQYLCVLLPGSGFLVGVTPRCIQKLQSTLYLGFRRCP